MNTGACTKTEADIRREIEALQRLKASPDTPARVKTRAAWAENALQWLYSDCEDVTPSRWLRAFGDKWCGR